MVTSKTSVIVDLSRVGTLGHSRGASAVMTQAGIRRSPARTARRRHHPRRPAAGASVSPSGDKLPPHQLPFLPARRHTQKSPTIHCRTNSTPSDTRSSSIRQRGRPGVGSMSLTSLMLGTGVYEIQHRRLARRIRSCGTCRRAAPIFRASTSRPTASATLRPTSPRADQFRQRRGHGGVPSGCLVRLDLDLNAHPVGQVRQAELLALLVDPYEVPRLPPASRSGCSA